ncbi:MAG: type IV pilus assembly protein PilM [Patescibacteria group bacterium]
MLNIYPFKNVFGLDISDSDIRLALLKKRGKEIIIASLNELPLPDGLIFDGEIKDDIKLRNLLGRLIKNTSGKKINTPYVNCVLPERKTFIKLIALPQSNTSDLGEAIKWEAAQHIPMSLEEMYLDWQIIDDGKRQDKNLSVLIAAAPKNIVDSYTNLLEGVGLTPISFETESMAITRSILSGQNNNLLPLLIIDLGGDHTNLIIFDKNSLQFSSTLSFSGKGITQKIAEGLKMTFADAEKAKIICGLETKKGKGQISKIITPLFSELIDKIGETENYYLNLFPGRQKFKKIILSGSGALLKNLDIYCQKKLNLPVDIANPLVHLNVKQSKIKILAEQACPFTTTIGLALKNLLTYDVTKSPLPGKKEKT